MNFTDLVFYFFAGMLVLAGMGVITSRNPVHSALFLVLSFFSCSALWLLLQAEFLAIVLVLVYVGAVMVLFLFVVMMLDINLTQMRQGFVRYLPIGALIALVMVAQMVWIVGPIGPVNSLTRQWHRALITVIPKSWARCFIPIMYFRLKWLRSSCWSRSLPQLH